MKSEEQERRQKGKFIMQEKSIEELKKMLEAKFDDQAKKLDIRVRETKQSLEKLARVGPSYYRFVIDFIERTRFMLFGMLYQKSPTM